MCAKQTSSGKSLQEQKDIPELLTKLSNAEVESDARIIELAKNKGVALIAFIMPYVSVRVSPIQEVTASISLPDEFGIETVINEIKKSKIKKAYLLVNSLGGGMASSYKLTRALRSCFEDITVFIPHIAASGGTLIALSGNKIVMGPMSHISPLDVQINYKGTSISMATLQRFFTRASVWFEKMTPDEAPYPQKALTDKLDPFIMEEWSGTMGMATSYVGEILKMSGNKNYEDIARQLVTGFPSHSFVITPDEAKDTLGLNIEDSSEDPEVWQIMRYWLGKYLLEESTIHCIRYFIPGN